MEKLKNSLTLGYILPIVLMLGLGADIALRFLPIHLFTFRSWEAVVRYPAPDAWFEPNKHLTYEKAYGDLAALGNLPKFRRYHSEVFTTDAFGFRNAPRDGIQGMGAIVFGDSFVVGNGVNDDETLSAQLSVLLGKPVYNAGAGPRDFKGINRTVDRLGMKNGYVIYEYMERDGDIPMVEKAPKELPVLTEYYLRAGRGWKESRARVILNGFCDFSPMEILAQRAFKSMQNDLFLPNTYRPGVSVEELVNGDTMLFLPYDVALSRKTRTEDENRMVEYLSWLDGKLREENQKLLVLLVPTKYTVYRKFLANQRTTTLPSGSYLGGVERRLRDKQISVINLTPTFIEKATAGIEDKSYIYFPDDTHWNADGIAVAAQEIRKFMLE